MGVFPKRPCDRQRFDAALRPPGLLITDLVKLTVMGTAKRDRELVTDFQANGSRLCKAQMMRVGRLPATDQTRLCRDELEVRLIAQALWLCDREFAFVYLFRAGDEGRDRRRGNRRPRGILF